MPGDVQTRQLRSDAARNRDRVLAAASELFGSVGVRAGIEDIARLAGVGVGTVCRNFPTKEALVAAVLNSRKLELLAEARASLAAPDPGAAFEQFLSVFADYVAAHRALAEGIAAEPNPGKDDRVRQELQRALSALVQRAQAVGTVRADVGPADVAVLMSGVAHAAIVAGSHDPQLRDRFIRIVLDGLRPVDPSPLPGTAIEFAALDAMRRK